VEDIEDDGGSPEDDQNVFAQADDVDKTLEN
jgi:hypothetical protein